MHPFLRTLLTRHEPVRGIGEHAKSALGAVAGILLIGALAYVTALPLLLAPLGATAVILFGYPGGALAQPVNVFGGYLLATVVGVATAMLFPGSGGWRRQRWVLPCSECRPCASRIRLPGRYRFWLCRCRVTARRCS